MKNVEDDLKKDGIEVIKPLPALSVTLISNFVAQRLSSAFPLYGLKYNSLFLKISNTPMYIAKIPSGMSEANYFYKNSTIYFKDGLTVDEMQKFAVHEFIHCYQELKDSKNYLHRLGLSDYRGMHVQGLALNEGSVQLLTAKALRNRTENVKYFGIELPTSSPSYYPLLTNLLAQMSYITGEHVLFDSTFNSNDNFKNSFINLCGNKAFSIIQKNLDTILETEEKLASLSEVAQTQELTDSKIADISGKIGKLKKKIQTKFIETQDLILTSYFDKSFNNIYTSADVEDFRKKLYLYKDLIGTTENYSYFNNYYINMMAKLSDKYDAINANVELVVYKPSFLQLLFSKLRLLTGNQSSHNEI